MCCFGNGEMMITQVLISEKKKFKTSHWHLLISSFAHAAHFQCLPFLLTLVETRVMPAQGGMIDQVFHAFIYFLIHPQVARL